MIVREKESHHGRDNKANLRRSGKGLQVEALPERWHTILSREGTYVVVKIRVSEEDNHREHRRELNVMKELASIHHHSPQILHMVDDFSLEGPEERINGW